MFDILPLQAPKSMDCEIDSSEEFQASEKWSSYIPPMFGYGLTYCGSPAAATSFESKNPLWPPSGAATCWAEVVSTPEHWGEQANASR